LSRKLSVHLTNVNGNLKEFCALQSERGKKEKRRKDYQPAKIRRTKGKPRKMGRCFSMNDGKRERRRDRSFC